MTQSDNRRVVIRPASVPLSQQDAPQRRSLPKPSLRTFALNGFLIALVGVATWIILVLPSHVDEVETVEVGAPPQVDGITEQPFQDDSLTDNIVPPFQQTELEKAQERANKTIAEVVQLQRLLRQELNVDTWASNNFRVALDQAIAADQLFLEARYNEAQAQYEAASASLRELRDEGLTRFGNAVARGTAALEALETEEAVAAFDEALSIQPNDAGALAGAERAALQPRVLELLRSAERAQLRGNLKHAEKLLREAHALDPLSAGLDAKIAQVGAARAEDDYREALSGAFGALERGEFERAETAFNRVLAIRPDDAGALAGLQQTGQRRTLSRINTLRTQAVAQEDAANWEAALATFDAALGIDSSLRFAREGRARMRARVELIQSIDAFLGDPAALSEDALFEEANGLLVRARAQTRAGAAFEAKTQALAELLSRAAKPVELVLVSDNMTDVVIHKVAALGSFTRHALSLRPGRYTIVGSRDGCRDVRMEILLEAGLPPVTVRCEERI